MAGNEFLSSQQKDNQKVLLRVTGLNKTYHSPSGDLSILQDMAFSLNHGEFLAVVGESGAGKSTLLQILGTLDDPDSGEAILDGCALFVLNQGERARFRNETIGFVYQAHHLIPELTALENVMLPLLVRGVANSDAEQCAVDLLTRLHLQDRLTHAPARLSGGEAQRVAVARALVGKPRLLLVDEPTGNLDELTAQGVFQAMLSMCQQEETAVIMVTHSMSLAHQADRILRLSQGRLIPA